MSNLYRLVLVDCDWYCPGLCQVKDSTAYIVFFAEIQACATGGDLSGS